MERFGEDLGIDAMIRKCKPEAKRALYFRQTIVSQAVHLLFSTAALFINETVYLQTDTARLM